MIKLRPYQSDVDTAIDECESNLILVVQPTGTGKTVSFGHYAVSRGLRTLVLTWSEELIEQTIDAFKMISPNVSIGRFVGNDKDLDSQIVVASVQTLKNINNLVLIDRDFSLVIVDEAHHISPTLKRILYAFGLCDLSTAGYKNVLFVEPDYDPDRKLIGYTATPDRTDELELSTVFEERIEAPGLEWFIEQGHLCDLKFISLDTGIDMSDVRSYAGDLSEGQMAKKLLESGYINELSRVIHEYLPNKKSILIYVPTADTAKIAAGLINDAGISSDYVIGAERNRRKEVIDRFKSGDIRVLVNCLVLKEGFDAPNVDAIVLCRPTKSKLLLRQFIGRGTRPHEDKDVCTIVDLVVQRRQQDIISASGIFDDLEMSPAEQTDKTVKEKIEEQRLMSGALTLLTKTIEDIKHIKELEWEDEQKKKKNKVEKELLYADIPDTVSLLLDTRMLREMGMDAKDFGSQYQRELNNLERGRPLEAWENNEFPHEYQMTFLKDNTNYTSEDISMLSPMEAQVMINIIKRQNKPTTFNRRKILTRVYNVPPDEVPERDVDARRLISSIAKGRVRHGKA